MTDTEHGRPAGRAADPDRLAELEEERRFLLRSLADLEREHEAGDVDDADYVTLRDGYTSRAAAVLRAIDAGRAAPRAGAPRRWGRLAAGVAIVLAVAVGLGWFVARSSGQRLPGQTVTGGPVAGDDVNSLLVRARLLLGTDPVQAQELYGQVLEKDPDQAEALAYSGWLLVILAGGASDELADLAIATGKEQLRRAIAVDPDYADPHCFLAIVAANFEDDPATGRTEGQACLANDPPADMVGLIEEQLVGDPAPTTAPTTTAG